MSKDLNNVVTINDGNIELARKSLDEGKTVEIAVEKGSKVTRSIAAGFMEHLNANLEVANETAPAGSMCACGKPANIVVRLWR